MSPAPLSPSAMSRSRKRRIISIHFPHLPTDRIARLRWGRSWLSRPRPEDPPFVIAAKANNALRVHAHEIEGPRFGLFRGQPLGDARALVPNLDSIEHDDAADRDLLNAVAVWCDRYTPLVATDGDDGLFLDITGCAHLFGGEMALLDDIGARLSGQGMQHRAAIAAHPGAAWALARFGKMRRISEGDIEPLLPLPLAALRIDDDTVTGLARVGLRTIGCISPLPRAPLAARFGKALLMRLDQALGDMDEAITPLRPAAPLMAEKRFHEPIGHEDDIRHAIALLSANAVPHLVRRGEGARRLGLRLYRVDGEVLGLEVQAANPMRDAVRMAALFDERLSALASDFDAGFGFDLMRLDIIETEPLPDAQDDMIDLKPRGDSVIALADRLGARLGPERVCVFAHADTHIPERRFALVPLVRAREAAPAPKPPKGTMTRPLWLLDRPEPLEVIAGVPDGPPQRFRWRKARYEVSASEGPERIACEWWRDGRGAWTRDYFRIEDQEGHRFWMFRHGLYERETVQPRWFMHGIFP